ncbi:murein biosynthesis integral membrane protein MurJ [Bradyrhizobium sp. NP1]|uniref:murein biosynthesis integral membrane protein MurJ n=1 Tax=Bradyrhizobium sp. NP1 TaxID=3049772 RepID=UPI0025A5C656|nr:murein biosynthesis integral membrane protein MurJ [Bradyrhizobium sp. NP1]WJR78274.1 murein biosynthesis integral membrane protein MurJ [Bradyrhizobium sp. NP1]
MIRSLLTVSLGTLSSRLLGFARDSLIAALLGAGPAADAFLAAFQLVNVVRRLLSEGALNAALVPAWLRAREAAGPAAAAAFAGRVLGTISAALVVISAVAAILMPLVIVAFAPGFVGHETLQLATGNARLMLPYLAFAGPVTVMLALSSAQGRFALAAFSPVLFNITLIAVTVALFALHLDAGRAALVIAAAVGIAGLLQLLVLGLRQGDRVATPLRIAFDKEMRVFLTRAMPGMAASAGPQLFVVAGAIVASSSPSAVSWLYFANRLIELPLGIVGVAMGMVLVPQMTRALQRQDDGAIAEAESRALELAVGLALPATLGLIALSEPIVRLLFEHGAFTATDTAATAQALIWLSFGLPAQVAVKSLSPAFFAREDTLTPLFAMLQGIAVAIAAALALNHFLGLSGIAAALALGAWANALVLMRRGAATFGFSIDAAARRRLPRMTAAALAMGALLWLGRAAMPAADHGLAQAAILAALIAGAILVYGLCLTLFGVTGWRQTVNAIRQAPPHDLRA